MKRKKVLKKIVASVLLLVFNVNMFAVNLVVDPNSKYNTSLDKSETGIPIINISTPNSRGVSINDFIEYNVEKIGQILNNSDNVGRSHLAGLINSNPNLGANQEANLIVLQVNGANRSQIEGYIEAFGRNRANVILSNENGLYLNGAGTINIKNFIPTTGKILLENGDYVGIDVTRGNIVIGEKGFDGTNTDFVDIITKALDLQGKIVGNDVRIVTGENKVSANGEIIEKIVTNPSSIAIDGSELGSMYAGQIKIIATEKGTGVNNKAYIVSKNNPLEISADGKIVVNKVQGKGIKIEGEEYEQKGSSYSEEGINVKANKIKLDGVGTYGEEIILEGNLENNSEIIGKKGKIKGNEVKNNDLILFEDELKIEGENVLNNNKAVISSGDKLEINGINNITNIKGEILGKEIKLTGSKIKNEVGIIEGENILIKGKVFENVGEVTDLDKYEKYYVTWDGIKLSEEEVNNWKANINEYIGEERKEPPIILRQISILNKLKKREKIKGYESLILKKYPNLIWGIVGSRILRKVDTSSNEIVEKALEGQLDSKAKTEYGKVISNGRIKIESEKTLNRDGVISGEEEVEIRTGKLENNVTLGDKILLQDGIETLESKITKRKKRMKRYYSAYVKYNRELNKGEITYVTGEPSIIEGKVVKIDTEKLVTESIKEANGKVNNGTANIRWNNEKLKEIKENGILKLDSFNESSLFVKNDNPTSKYIMETRSKHIRLSEYYASDYFLDKVGYEEKWDRVRRLGDAYYENQLIGREIKEKLGISYINGRSEKEIIKELLDNGVELTKKGKYRIGEELEREEIKGLEKDAILYVLKEVNGVEILVPEIYLSEKTKLKIEGSEKNQIGGLEYTEIKAKDIENRDTILGKNGVTKIEGEKIVNKSKIKGEKTFVLSKEDIQNIGGEIEGEKEVVLVSERGDILNETTKKVVEYNYGEYNKTKYEKIDKVGEIKSEGKIVIEGKKYESKGALVSGEKIDFNVDNIKLNRVELFGSSTYGNDGENYRKNSKVENVGSSVQGTNGVRIIAGKDVDVLGSEISSKGNVEVTGENINITNAINSLSTENKFKNKKTFKSVEGSNSSYVESNQSSTIYGNSVVLNAINDVNVKASNIVAEKDTANLDGNVNIKAGGDVNIISDTTTEEYSSSYSKSSSVGALPISSKGNAQGMGQTIQNASNIIANGGNITINSENDISISGSELTTKDDVKIIAKGNINITGVDESYGNYYTKHKGGLFRGGNLYKFNSKQHENTNITNKESILKAGNNVIVHGENISILSSDFDTGKDISINANENLLIKSRNEYYGDEHKEKEIKMGFYGSLDKLSAKVGIEAKITKNKTKILDVKPDESTLVANNNINLTSDKNLYFEGDMAAGQNINISSTNVMLSDSKGLYSYLEKEIQSRLGIGVELNFNNLLDTFKSLKNYYEGIKAVGELHELIDIVNDLLNGQGLLESLEGNEDTINALNNLFKGPSEGSGKAGIFAQASIDVSKNKGKSETIEKTSLSAGNNINVNGKDNLGIRGTNIMAFNDIDISSKNMDIQASKVENDNENKAYGLFGEVNVLNGKFSLSGNYKEGETEGYNYNNTVIDAKNNLKIIVEDGEIKGANISGNDINVKVKNNLKMESLQDYEKRKEIGVNLGIGNITGENKSYNGGLDYTRYKKNWISKETTLIGRNNVDVEVGETLTLTGAKISNEKNGVDKGNLVVKANEIIANDIMSEEKNITLDANINITKKDIYNEKTNKYEKYENDGGVGLSGLEKEKISRATIGKGTVIVSEGTSKNINRDIFKAVEETKNVNVDRVGIDYNDERREWGEVSEIVSENAGTLGKFTDDMGILKISEDKTNEEIFRNNTYTVLRKTEDFIDKSLGNQAIGIIPTSGQYGGLGEQIVKTIIKDKVPLYKIGVQLDGNGEYKYSVLPISNLSEVTPKDGKEVQVFINGMTEELENSIKNAIGQNLGVEDYKKLQNGETFEVVLAYNKTRGFLTDTIESMTGKMFDGSKISGGLSLGVSRGFVDVLNEMKDDTNYTVKSYSQGNIVEYGALNVIKNKGDIFNDNVNLVHTGSPIANKGFVSLEKDLKINSNITVINKTDPIGSEEEKLMGIKGFISETVDVDKEYSPIFSKLEKIPILVSLTRMEKYPLLETPILELYNKKINSETKEKINSETKEKIKEVQGLKTDKELEKFLDNAHGMYFKDDEKYVEQLVQLENKKESMTTEEYKDSRNEIKSERIKNVLSILSTVKAQNLEEINKAKLDAIKEEMKNNTQTFKETNNLKEKVKIEKKKKEVQLPLDIENELNNLRERVGK